MSAFTHEHLDHLPRTSGGGCMSSPFCTSGVQSATMRRVGRALAFATLLAGFVVGSIVTAPAAGAQQLATRRSFYVVRFASELDESDAPVLLRQPITIRLRNVTLERALQEISSNAGMPLSYSRSVVP